MTKAFEDIQTIVSRINEIKRRSKSAILSNYFKQELKSYLLYTLWSENTVIFCDKDIDFYRLYFYSNDLDDLRMTIQNVALTPVMVDIITIKFSEDLDTLFIDSGFKNIAVYKHIINNNFPVYKTTKELSFADPIDLEIMYNHLFEDFDKYMDHLPEIEKLRHFIENKQVIVMRERDNICGYIIFQVLGKRAFLNYWYNEGKSLDSLMLLINFYGVMKNRGIVSGFGWVNSENNDIIKTHEKFGFRFDGREDYIYLNDRKE